MINGTAKSDNNVPKISMFFVCKEAWHEKSSIVVVWGVFFEILGGLLASLCSQIYKL
jgi:hypothetical protein